MDLHGLFLKEGIQWASFVFLQTVPDKIQKVNKLNQTQSKDNMCVKEDAKL